MSIQTLEFGHLVDAERRRACKEASEQAAGLSTDYLRGYLESFNENAGFFRKVFAPIKVYAFSEELDRRSCVCKSQIKV